jgi:hypothetical protein
MTVRMGAKLTFLWQCGSISVSEFAFIMPVQQSVHQTGESLPVFKQFSGLKPVQ